MEYLLLGLSTAIQPTNLLSCLTGVFVGTAIGVIPGLGPLAAISLLLPLTFSLEPVTAVIMLAGIYYGAQYGGSTTAILMNLPGESSSAITAIEGYQMALNGRAGAALFVTTISSFIGGTAGIILLMMTAPLLVKLGQAIGPAEYFALIVFCFIAIATVGGNNPLKGLTMLAIGALLGTVGIDIYDGAERFTFGSDHLIDGIGLVPVAMGLFGLSEMIASVGGAEHRVRYRVTLRAMLPNLDEIRRSIWPTFRGSGIGCALGALPGTGPTLATIISYATEKRISRQSHRFGKGAVEGIAAPEAANNSAAQTAFIPTLTLGIPGSPTMAIIIGALMIHGVVPGPQLISNHPDLYFGLVASFWIGNLLLLLLNLPLVGIWISLLSVPYRYLYPAIVALICIGCYGENNNTGDVVTMLSLGIGGYLLVRLNFPPAPLLIGFILGPMLEENFRRAMILADGDGIYLVSSPISAIALIVSALLLVRMAISDRHKTVSHP